MKLFGSIMTQYSIATKQYRYFNLIRASFGLYSCTILATILFGSYNRFGTQNEGRVECVEVIERTHTASHRKSH